MTGSPLRVGVLAIQGGFAAHERGLGELGAQTVQVRGPADLEGLDGLVLPGGESTTIAMGLERQGLDRAVAGAHARGLPLLGTCAGMILLDREHLGLLDVRCERNAWGRQVRSFETDLRVAGIGDDPLRAVFIRAPKVRDAGAGVEVLAVHEDEPVVVRQDRILASSFHPELTGDWRLHALFCAICSEAEFDPWSPDPVGPGPVGPGPVGPDHPTRKREPPPRGAPFRR